MAPARVEESAKDFVGPKKDTLRLTKVGIDVSNGYPHRPDRPLCLRDMDDIRTKERKHVDVSARVEKSKRSRLSAATKVTDLTTLGIGTETEGLKLKDLTDQQKDELALLIARRSVGLFRDQNLSPQQPKDIEENYGEDEVHVNQPLLDLAESVPGVTSIWLALQATEVTAGIPKPGGVSRWFEYTRQPLESTVFE